MKNKKQWLNSKYSGSQIGAGIGKFTHDSERILVANHQSIMKNSLLSLGVLLTALIPAKSLAQSQSEMDAVSRHLRDFNESVNKVRKENSPKAWKPQTIVESKWLGYGDGTGTWGDDEIRTLEYYDETGWIKSETLADTRTDYEYDSNGNMITRDVYDIVEGEAVLSSKTTVKYDERVPNFWTEQLHYISLGDELMLYLGFRHDLDRDEAGNVVKITFLSFYPWYEDWSDFDGSYIGVEYGSDGKASRIYEMEYKPETQQLKEITALDNIQWYSTDGQITNLDLDIDPFSFYMGSNRIKSADVTMESFRGTAVLSAEYPTENSVDSEITLDGSIIRAFKYADLGSNNSFEQETTTPTLDYDEETHEFSIAGFITTYMKRVIDDYGFITTYIDEHFEDGVFYDAMYENGEATAFDESFGYPTEYLIQRSWDGVNFWNIRRYSLSNFIEVGKSEAEALLDDAANTEVLYFNLQGLPVANPQNGLFIRKEGTKTSKVKL